MLNIILVLEIIVWLGVVILNLPNVRCSPIGVVFNKLMNTAFGGILFMINLIITITAIVVLVNK